MHEAIRAISEILRADVELSELSCAGGIRAQETMVSELARA